MNACTFVLLNRYRRSGWINLVNTIYETPTFMFSETVELGIPVNTNVYV